MQYAILTQLGVDLINSEEFGNLAACIEEFNSYHKPVEEISYHKVYRGLREFGMYCQPIWCADTGRRNDVRAFIVVFREYNSTKVKSFGELQPRAVAPSAQPTPLEILIEQEAGSQSEQEALAPVQEYDVSYHKHNQITGAINKLVHHIEVRAVDKAQAELQAYALLDKGQKHPAFIIGAALKYHSF